MRNALFTSFAVLAVCGAAIADPADKPGHKSPAPGENSNAMSATEDAAAGMVGRISAEMTTTTKGFVTAAAISDMYEVAAGKIAVERAQSAEVKAFAQQMVDAHTQTTDKLKGIMTANNIKVTPPAHVDSRRQMMLDNLRGAAAADFDKRYITQQVAAHTEADILMRGYAKDGDSAAIKAFAGETDKAVKTHLAHAKKLEAAMKK
jgi:putative membrane protein